MRLDEYWGVGPKTRDRLATELGVEGAVEAIESADVRALVDAGVSRGRATRILRRANAQAGMDLLATPDTRSVYDDLLSLAGEYALTRHAADRIRVLTPLSTREAREERLSEVVAARDAWVDLDDDAREAVVDAFAEYERAEETERAAVEAALELREAGLRGQTFLRLRDIEDGPLQEAAHALGHLVDGGDDAVARGADEELDSRRDRLAETRRLERDALDVLESVRERGVRDLEDFERAFVDRVAGETSVDRATVREATPTEAVDAADFASTTLRELVAEFEERVADRERRVAADLRESVDRAREDVDAAVEAVDDIALWLSLGRFADAADLTRPTYGYGVVAVEDARNLFLDGDVQPITYAVGDHDLGGVPTGHRVAVLTGANSGGKTTLLETLCTVAIMAGMGLPVPAERATVGEVDSVVFHRRHASFNAGVLESTLRSVVPPLTDGGRTLMLVDEFEAITEPGRAADLLDGLVGLTVQREALGVYVTHLADELSPLPEAARVDGIFAEGLTEDLALRVDYQPRFETVGRSTPEFIVSRLVANARDRSERRGFEALAAAIGEEAVQRTLADARFRQ